MLCLLFTLTHAFPILIFQFLFFQKLALWYNPFMENNGNDKRIFICYSSKDSLWRDRLITCLKARRLGNRLKPWSDEDIPIGENWRHTISEALSTADAAIFIVSPDFLASPFIQEVEVPELARRRSKEGLLVIPVIVRPCSWEKTDFLQDMQAVMLPGRRALSKGIESDWDEKLSQCADQMADYLSRRKNQNTIADKTPHEQINYVPTPRDTPRFSKRFFITKIAILIISVILLLYLGFRGETPMVDNSGEHIDKPGDKPFKITNSDTEKQRLIKLYETLPTNSPERLILHFLSFFDKPVPGEIITELRKHRINGITDTLFSYSEEQWNTGLTQLKLMGLAITQIDSWGANSYLLEFLQKHVAKLFPEGYREANQILYDYYRKLPKKEQPDTLEELEPLFSAVAHGCRAGIRQEVWDEVFQKRIRRGKEAYIVLKLRAYDVYLSVLTHFFAEPWRSPVPELKEEDRTVLLGYTGFALRALGRLREATQPLRVNLDKRIRQKNWKNAALAATNLTELLGVLGELKEAEITAREGVALADRSRDLNRKMIERTTLAEVLFRQEKNQEAEGLYREAEALQKKIDPKYPQLYSGAGYSYCDLLLAMGRWPEALQRGEYSITICRRNNLHWAVALDYLTIGRARLAQGMAESRAEAITSLNRAVDGLRKVGGVDDLPKSLLARASGYRLLGQFHLAQKDLTEALKIIDLGSMLWDKAAYHREMALLYEAQGEKALAEEQRRLEATLRNSWKS